jgi:predicted Zn-dependent peptidase
MKRILISLAFMLAGSAAAGTFSHGVRGRLSNGIDVILLHDPSLPVVATGIFVQAGAENETEQMSGATHLLEHMLFNGTKSMSQESLYTFMELHGLYVNAATRKRGTIFIGLAPPQELQALLDVQSDMLFASTIPAEKLDKEKQIVLEELARDRTRADTFVDALHASLVYAGTSGRFPILGSPATVERMSREMLYGYYRRYYIPNNTTLILVGNFPWPDTWDLLKDSFSKYAAKPEPPLTELRLPAVSSVPNRTVSAPVPNPVLLFTFEAPEPSNPDFPAFYMIMELLDDLVQELGDTLVTDLQPTMLMERNESRCVLRIESSDSTLVPFIPDHLDTLLKEAKRAVEGGDYVDVARTQWVTSLLRWMERPHMFAIMAYDLISTVGWDGAELLEEAVDTLEASHISEVIDRWLIGQPRAQLTILPGSERPSFESLDPKPDAGGASSLRPFGSAPAFDEIVPDIANVAGSIEAGALSTICDTLSSGIVLCVRREHGLPLSAMHLLFRRRGELEPQGKEGVAEILHRLFEKGPRWMEEKDYTRKLGSLGAQIKVTDNPYIPFDDYYFSSRWGYVRMTTPTGTFFPAARLLTASLQSPSIDSLAVSNVRRAVNGILFREGSSPRETAGHLFWSRLHPGDPRGRSPRGIREAVANVSVDDVRTFGKRYLDASNIIVTVSTTLDAQACLDSLTSIFGDMGGIGSVGADPSSVPSVQGPWVAEDSLGAGQSYIMTGMSLSLAPSEYQSLEVLAAVLGRRMERTLREEKGLAYGLGAFAQVENSHGVLGAYIGTRPERRLEAQTDLKILFAELIAEPFDNRLELRASAKRLQQRTVLRRLTREGRAMALGLRLLRGQEMTTEAKELAGYLSVTPEHLYRLVSRLDRDQICWVIVR